MVKDWIDDILEANENQKPSFGYLGYVESLIETSNNSVQQKSELLNSIDEQYKEMVKRGVFK